MRLDGFGLFVQDMGTMIRFYRDVLGFEIQESEDAGNVYLVKDGTLFLLYGLYRAIGRPGMSLVLTVISLGTRVLLAYLLAPIPAIGVTGVWAAIPIGWFLADCVAVIRYVSLERRERA